MCQILLKSQNAQNLQKVRKMMKKNGWTEQSSSLGFIMQHNEVKEQQEARKRLYNMGILTSSTIEITIQ